MAVANQGLIFGDVEPLDGLVIGDTGLPEGSALMLNALVRHLCCMRCSDAGPGGRFAFRPSSCLRLRGLALEPRAGKIVVGPCLGRVFLVAGVLSGGGQAGLVWGYSVLSG